ncbi:MAG: hypothetical protein ABJM26_19540 [Anderseniella sp.]
MSGQFYFLMRVGRTPRAALRHGRPCTIQQPNAVQCESSTNHNGDDYEHLFHGSAFYMKAAQSSKQLDFKVNSSAYLKVARQLLCCRLVFSQPPAFF